MSLRVPVKPELLRWACRRSGRDMDYLQGKFTKLTEWESGETRPTLKQLEAFAKATYTPIGYMFLDKPPKEKMPIPDLRTMRNREVVHPSPDLLDVIHICQQRQEWYRDFARTSGYGALDFVGSASIKHPVEDTAANMRKRLGFGIEERMQEETWTGALRQFIEQVDALGVMVMTSGIVGNHTRRKLNPEEFRGFALSDKFAPLIFINGNDTKAAQMFTLAHELAHIWLGDSALSDATPASQPSRTVERWCNKVAAEFLVPLAAIKESAERDAPIADEIPKLAREYKVSTLVILCRLSDAGFISSEAFAEAYQAELSRSAKKAEAGTGGGDFYRTTEARVSKRFVRDLVASTFEGQTSFTETFQLLGIKKMATFKELGK